MALIPAARAALQAAYTAAGNDRTVALANGNATMVAYCNTQRADLQLVANFNGDPVLT